MTTKYQHLFSPLKINKFVYKNRIVAAPMGFGKVFERKESAAMAYRKIEDSAKGGAAAVNVGETSINSTDAERMAFGPVDYNQYSGPDFLGFKKYADLIKKHDALALIELFHAGQEKVYFPGKPNPRGPVGFVRADGVTVDEMNEEMMDKACSDFAIAAKFMQTAGFNGILVHAGHGWLFSQFLSPLFNKRTDRYGGSLENRARFPIKIFERVRQHVGADFIIEARISGRDGVPGGIEAEEVGRFCKMLEGTVDSVHISAGLYMNPVATNQFSSMFAEHGCNAGLSAIVKKHTSLPVGVVGGINSPELAEKIIAEGKADFVVLARQLIADREFPNKAKNGRDMEIRRCIRCFTCFPGSAHAGYKPPKNDGRPQAGFGSCTINPVANLPVAPEDMPKPTGQKNVLIAGGGVAGMQAAITVADRGHKVTLVEKSDKLGGILNFTEVDVDKEDLCNFKNLLVREVNQRNMDIRLNTEVNPDYIKEMEPDAIIIAIGSSPLKPPIPGIQYALHALDVYNDTIKLGKNIIMVGGGLVGCETGLHLAKTGHNVIVIEMLDTLANESFGMYREALMLEMQKFNMIGKTKTRCLEITPEGVGVENENGTRDFINADSVVFALGMRANKTADLRTAAAKIPVYEIGDCVRGAKVFEAVHEGFLAAMQIV